MNIALPVQLMTARIPRRYDVLWLSLSVCYYRKNKAFHFSDLRRFYYVAKCQAYYLPVLQWNTSPV